MTDMPVITLPSRVHKKMLEAGGLLLRLQSEIVAFAEPIQPIHVGRGATTEEINKEWDANLVPK